MFRIRGKEKEIIEWSNLLALLEDDDQRAAIEMLHPQLRRESFLGALQRLDAGLCDRLLASGRQLNNATRLIDWPTVAVAGMLNSGKTSLVATFLSEDGRSRSLRGTSNAHGTHRFVIWLPSQWRKDAELWELLMQRIGDAVGQKPEPLAPRMEKAGRWRTQLRKRIVSTTTRVATQRHWQFLWSPRIRNWMSWESGFLTVRISYRTKRLGSVHHSFGEKFSVVPPRSVLLSWW